MKSGRWILFCPKSLDTGWADVTTDDIPETLVQEFSAALAARTGLHFPAARRRDLLRGVARAAAELGFVGARASETGMRWLLAERPTRRQTEFLASHLAVGETYFFREPTAFSVLENEILPPLIAARRASGKRLRVWSAGCCTGEETYSLAILLARLIPDIEDWSITLLGTDINAHFLGKAAHGVYREWSFRGVPAWIRERYFNDIGAGNYALLPRFKQLPRFEHLNLVGDAYPSGENNAFAMDIVLCRNVLMYFDAATARTVVQKLRRALVDGGWLIVSQMETSRTLFAEFIPVAFPGCVLYRKDGNRQAVRGDASWWAGGAKTLPEPSLIEESRPDIRMGGMTWDAAGNACQSVAAGPSPSGCEATHSADYPKALAHYARGAYERVLDILSVADTEEPQSLALLARACANLGRLDDARRWCNAAVAADRFNPGLRYFLASILTELGHAEEAATALKQVLYLDRNFILAHFALGNLYRRKGHTEPAAKHFAIAARLLRGCPPGSTVPESEGLSAGRLLSIINATEASA
jgi:chemotaxis protein methyltransferase CheR